MPEHRSFLFHLHTLVFIILTFLSAALLALSSGGFLLDFKKIGFTVMSTGQQAVFTVYNGCAKFVSSVKKLSVLDKEYRILTEKLRNYEYMQRNNAEILRENEQLRELLGFSRTLVNANTPANIIGRDSDTMYSTLIIDKGSKHGIKKNMPVIAVQSGNIGLVGKIVTVGYTTSMIIPVYNVQFNVSARMRSKRDLGIVSGMGTGENQLVMKYIRKSVFDELNYGDTVVTSGENGNYLQNIPIGVISKISLYDYDSFLEIELVPIIDFPRLENVVVVDIATPNSQEAEK
ncbi:MAG: rod shape-determining protein MreC [Bacteroides sp.]|nr:rod shape-determining protein MreC [Prevotella sp.]MCM1407901.1 rod shape-determining protein MreC [Treponema brennaborense]MCM1469643.1 rod shape-determining protein MreC [Bacteroides sp.]